MPLKAKLDLRRKLLLSTVGSLCVGVVLIVVIVAALLITGMSSEYRPFPIARHEADEKRVLYVVVKPGYRPAVGSWECCFMCAISRFYYGNFYTDLYFASQAFLIG